MVERREDTPSVPSNGEAVETKLRRIARKARSDQKFQFTRLFHLMNEELLRGCFKRLRGRAAADIDGVTKVSYARTYGGELDRVGRVAPPNGVRTAKCSVGVPVPRLHTRVDLHNSS